jgi:hypothetical protein
MANNFYSFNDNPEYVQFILNRKKYLKPKKVHLSFKVLNKDALVVVTKSNLKYKLVRANSGKKVSIEVVSYQSFYKRSLTEPNLLYSIRKHIQFTYYSKKMPFLSLRQSNNLEKFLTNYLADKDVVSSRQHTHIIKKVNEIINE